MSSPVLQVLEQRVAPIRGLVPLHNAHGRFFTVVDLRRWIRLCRVIHKTEKIDLLVMGAIPQEIDDVVSFATDAEVGMGVELSLRTDCTVPPDRLETLKKRGLAGAFLCPPSHDAPHLDAWLKACEDLELPVRLQLPPPSGKDFNAEALAEHLAASGVKAVNVTLEDPFSPPQGSQNGVDGQALLERMTALVSALDARDVEANLLHLPLCLLSEEQRVFAANSQQFFLDHQQYKRESYELATRLYRKRPWAVGKIVLLMLGRTSRGTTADLYLLAWLSSEHPYLHAAVSLYRKLTRHVGILRSLPRPIDNSKEAYEAEIERRHLRANRRLGPRCSQCRLRRICDHETPAFKRRLADLGTAPEPGELFVGPMHFAKHQRKYYDAIDAERADSSGPQQELAKEARLTVDGVPPSREFAHAHYTAHNTFCMQLPGAVQWFSLTNGEKISTEIAWLRAPFTISITFGGGIADYVGFSLGHLTKILCPMEAYSHRVVLHVDQAGKYVLLRDDAIVRPVEFEGSHGIPTLVPTRTPIRLSIWNIDRYIYSQNLQIWEGTSGAVSEPETVKCSIVIVCMRFARRLQATLQCIAHQRGINFDELEVIVAYVPGLDATEDLLTSMELAYPNLRFIRSPFPERYLNAKGHVINRSVELAQGDWVMLLDSDTLIPPDFLEHLSGAPETASFVAPDRRKMLSRETSADILLGRVKPWEQWQEILDGPGEMRVQEGGYLPVGFLQCVRSDCAKAIQYEEYGHYQGADWEFIVNIYKEFGPGEWLKGVSVLHLDHGGSQWFGARKHL